MKRWAAFLIGALLCTSAYGFWHGTAINQPAIYSITSSGNPGDVVSIVGTNLSGTPTVTITGENTGPITPSTIIQNEKTLISFKIPPTAPQDIYDIKVINNGISSNTKSIGIPIVKWIEYPVIATGDSFMIIGENIALPAASSGCTTSFGSQYCLPTVTLKDNNGATQAATVTAYDDRTVTVTAPTIVVGNTYTAEVNNGYATSTYSTDYTTGISSSGTDYFSLGVPWGRQYNSTNIYNVVTNSNFANCDPTGVADASSCTQACITYANSQGGGICYFPAGTYLFVANGTATNSHNIQLASNVVIQGAGTGSTTFEYGATTAQATGWFHFFINIGTNDSLSGLADVNFVSQDTISQTGDFALGASTGASEFFIQRVNWNLGTGDYLQFGNKIDSLVMENSTYVKQINYLYPLSSPCQQLSGEGPIVFAGMSHFYLIGNTITNNTAADGVINSTGTADHSIIQNNNFIRSANDKVQVTSANLSCFQGNNFIHPFNIGDYGLRQLGHFVSMSQDQDEIFQNNKIETLDGFSALNGPNLEGFVEEYQGSTSNVKMTSATTTTSSLTTITGTPSGGAWKSVVAGDYLAVVNGTGSGEVTTVVSIAGNTITVADNWVVLPAAGDQFVVSNATNNLIVRNNYFTGSGGPCVSLFRPMLEHAAVENNVCMNFSGIMVNGVTDANNTLSSGYIIEGGKWVDINSNMLVNAYGEWPSWILVGPGLVSPYNLTTRLYDTTTIKGNVIVGSTFVANGYTPSSWYPTIEGYYSDLSYSGGVVMNPANDTSQIFYGLIFQNNYASNVSTAYTFYTGNEGDVIWNAQGSSTNYASVSMTWGQTLGALNTTIGTDATFVAPVSLTQSQIWVPDSTPVVGQAAVVSIGKWEYNPTSCTKQWKTNGTNISGATGWFYIPVTADATKTLTATVTCLNSAGSASVTTPGLVVAAAPTTTPVIRSMPIMATSAPVHGVPITVASLGNWTGDPAATTYSCEWLDNGVPIVGATSCTGYTPQVSDEGLALCLAVAATVSGNTSGYQQSFSYKVN